MKKVFKSSIALFQSTGLALVSIVELYSATIDVEFIFNVSINMMSHEKK